MFQQAAFQEHNLSVRGANEVVNYSISGAINSGESNVGTADWKNYKFGANTQFSMFNKRLKIGEDFRMQYWKNTGRGNGQWPVDVLGGLRMPQYAPVEDASALGGYSYVTTTNDLNDATNPVTDMRLGKYLGQGTNFNLNLKADLEIIKGLNLHSSYAIMGGNSSSYSYLKARQNGNLVYPDAQLDENISYWYTSVLENYLTYKKKIGDHDFSVMVGNNVLKPINNRGIGAIGRGFTNDAVTTMNVARDRSVSTNGITIYGNLAYFGRLTYSYKDKYLLTANVRRDASDKFGPLNKWGTFPAVAAAWKISEEAFLQGNTTISFLKLRAGYGITGNDQISSFSYTSNVHSNVAYAFPSRTTNSFNGATINSSFNPSIQWEEVASTNIGLDIGLLNDRVMITADYFNKETRDMIVDIPLPPSLGFGNNGGGGNANVNAGNMVNKGVELTISTKHQVGDLTYIISANGTFISNEVTNLAGGVPYNDGGLGGFGSSNRTEEGHSVGFFYGYKMDRVYATQEQVNADNEAARVRAKELDPTLTDAQLADIFYISSSTKAGDIRFKDTNGDGIVTEKDRTDLGSSIPKVMYGFSVTLGYKGFDFFMNWNGRQGNKILYELGYHMEGMIRPFNSSTEVLNRWKSEADPGNGLVPRAVKNDPSGNLRMSDRFIYSGSYLRLSLVSLGYTVPRTALDNIFAGYVKNLRVYVSSDNPLTVTKYRGYNPEVGGDVGQRGRGRDTGYLPVARTFRAGLQLTF
jgi:TonB-linked SusC/RagA family outer membrane protein